MKSFVAVLAFVALAAADVSHLDSQSSIVAQNADVLPDQFNYSYETSNGIRAQESGVLKNFGKDGESIDVQGSNTYTAPDGQVISVNYVANELGYQPTGSHLPVPPEVPEYILRSLQYIATHPQPVEQKRF